MTFIHIYTYCYSPYIRFIPVYRTPNESWPYSAITYWNLARLWESSLEITWFSCPDRTLKIMSQIKFDFLNQLIARSAISLKIKYESQIKSLRKS